MGRRRIDSLSDISRAGYWARITCRGCGHVVHANPLEMMKGRGAAKSLDRIEPRLRCSQCGGRGGRIEVCAPPG